MHGVTSELLLVTCVPDLHTCHKQQIAVACCGVYATQWAGWQHSKHV